MTAEPTNIGELVAVLKEIAQTNPTDKVELRQLENRCVALSRYLSKNRKLGFEIDEWVWHFLSDADIRFKDPRYAEQQLAAFRAQVDELAARA